MGHFHKCHADRIHIQVRTIELTLDTVIARWGIFIAFYAAEFASSTAKVGVPMPSTGSFFLGNARRSIVGGRGRTRRGIGHLVRGGRS